jgi:hypothetical protein
MIPDCYNRPDSSATVTHQMGGVDATWHSAVTGVWVVVGFGLDDKRIGE